MDRCRLFYPQDSIHKPKDRIDTLIVNNTVIANADELRLWKVSEMPLARPRKNEMIPPMRKVSIMRNVEASFSGFLETDRAKAEVKVKTPPRTAIISPTVSMLSWRLKLRCHWQGANFDEGGGG